MSVPTPTRSRAAVPADLASAGERWESELGSVRLLFGRGRLGELGERIRALGGRRVLLVTDAGLVAAGHAAAAEESLRRADLEAIRFAEVEENPTDLQVERAAATLADRGIDAIAALGGGSSLDCAKGINFLLTNGGRMEDYRGFGRAERPLLPSIGVPTTAGTGSEAQSYAVIADAETHEKMACGDPGASFRDAILDPLLLATVPLPVAAAAGLDAVSHAVESFVSTRRNPISALYAGEAWRLLDGAFEAMLENPADVEVGSAMLLGAHLAGAAIEQSMLGAAHAAANPLTARYGVTHGAAVLLMLPWVVRFNGEAAAPLYRQLAGNGAGPDPAAALSRRLEALRASGGLPTALREVDVERDALPVLARRAAAQWTGRFNPRPVGEEEFQRLYEAAW